VRYPVGAGERVPGDIDGAVGKSDGVMEGWKEERIEHPTLNIQLPTLNERQR
jgi:hypothetical protein